MKYNELQSKSVKELQALLKEARVNLGKLRFELNNKALSNSSKIKATRKEVAKILTAIKSGASSKN